MKKSKLKGSDASTKDTISKEHPEDMRRNFGEMELRRSDCGLEHSGG